MSASALLQKIDSIRVPVPNLDIGLAFYRDQLGHVLIWRLPHGAGLRMPGGNVEIVLVPEGEDLQVNFQVASADTAADRFAEAGGKILVEPFDTLNGRAVVVQDPFGNVYAMRDDRLGELVTDEQGTVLGTEAGENSGA